MKKIKWQKHWMRIIPELDMPAYNRGMRWTRFAEDGWRQQYRKVKPRPKPKHNDR